MCLFITAAVPRTAQTHAFSQVVRQHKLTFSPCDNPHVAAQLRPAEQYVSATGSHCDCGSPLFRGSRAASAETVAREVDKLRKKKWSEAKIAKCG
jgi:hypothetical protein